MKKALKIFLLSMIGLFCFSSCEKPPVQEEPVKEEVPPIEYLEFYDEKEILASPDYDGFVYKFEKFQNPDAWAGPTYGMDDRFELTRIPDEEMSKLGAEGMALSALFHPLRGTWIAYDSVWLWFENIMIPYSNLLKELSERPNGAGYLLKVYNNMRVPSDTTEMRSIDSYSLEIKDKCTILDQGYMPLLISSEVFLNQLSDGGCKLFAEIAFGKFLEQYQCPEIYSWFSLKCQLLAAAKALLRIADFTEEERDFLAYFIRMSGRVKPEEMVPIMELIQSKVIQITDN